MKFANKKIDVLIPVYKPDKSFDTVISRLLNQKIKVNKIIIINTVDHKSGELKNIWNSDKILIKNIQKSEFNHGLTRNYGMTLSDADYVMYCDSDDGFCNTFALKIIFENIDISEKEGKPFDLMSSKFYVEKPAEGDKPWALSITDHNNIYIHGRVYRREYLVNYNLYFNENIWANEDSFFNIATNFYSNNTKLLNIPIYCWRGNPLSVTHDPKYIMKTLHQLIYSNDSVIEVMLLLNKPDKDIAKSAFDIICKVYLDMNKPAWYEPENKEYKDITIKTLKWYINKRGLLCNCLTDDDKRLVLQGARNTEHYKNIESITFNDFIKVVMSYE